MPAPPGSHAAPVDEHRITITLELALSGDSLTGTAVRDGLPPRSFGGWIGLVGAIDALVHEAIGAAGAAGGGKEGGTS